jgi:hypothetical protein
MYQFKYYTIDEMLRHLLIEHSLKYHNREMFENLTGRQWRRYIINEDYEERVYTKS